VRPDWGIGNITVTLGNHTGHRRRHRLRTEPHAGNRATIHEPALLLTRHARLDDLLTLLRAHLTDGFMMSTPVEAATDGDHDDRGDVDEDLMISRGRRPGLPVRTTRGRACAGAVGSSGRPSCRCRQQPELTGRYRT
jgi:hypothetical protein